MNSINKLDCFKMLDGHEVEILNYYEENPSVLSEKIKDAEVLVLTRERTQISEALLSELPNLKLISQTGKISNHLDLAACNKYKVAVAEGVGSPVAPSELTWALIMNTTRLIPQAVEGMKQGKWQTTIGTAINGKTIGIWGYGKIGSRIAKYAKAFDANVLIWGSESSREKAEKDGYEAAASKADFFSRSDIVTIHLRLVPATMGIVKKEDLALMKPTAAFINTARFELVEEGALLSSLKEGRPGYAGLDVYEKEPIYQPTYEFLNMPNVVCTPHIGYVEKQGYELYFGKAFENIVKFAAGSPENIINPEVL